MRDAATQSPLEGALLHVASYIAATDAQGRYAIAVPRGVYTLTVESDGYVSAQIPVNGTDLFARVFTVDVALETIRITGIVRDAETNQPLPNVQVMVGDKPVLTNPQGVFEARGVKMAAPVAVHVLGYQPTVVEFAGQSDVAVTLVPNTVNVRVTDRYTNQPVPNAKIQADNQTANGDAQGRATLRRVKPGASVSANAPGYESASAPFVGSDLQFAPRPTTLEGIVTDVGTGQPISNTLVYLGNSIVTTNAQGRYRLENVPAKATIALKISGYRKTTIDVSGTAWRDVKLSPFVAKGIRIPFNATPERVRELIDLVNKTELNALVVDVKSEKGRIAWDTRVPLAKQIEATSPQGIDLPDLIKQCRQYNIYCIARFVVFQDTLLATARPNLAILNSKGTVFTEGNGAAWANPRNGEVWNYNLALAKEVVALGFDEIQFDYVRFPGLINGLVYGPEITEESRVATIAGFLARAQRELRPTGVFISADVFGLTTATDDDQYTGQRLRDLAPYLDYVSPMVYPDVWIQSAHLITRGLGISNCTDAIQCPYEVIYNSCKRAAEKTSTKVRLWLQGYPGRGDFGLTQYRLQKKAATDAGSYGWMFWSGQGNYDVRIFGPPE